MFKKSISSGLAALLFCVVLAGCGEERVASEKRIAQIDTTTWIPESFKVSPDGRRVAYGAGVGDQRLVVVDDQEGKRYDEIV
jgi:hypothetical protein